MPNDNVDLSSLRIAKDKKDHAEGRPIPWKVILPAAAVLLIGGGFFLLRGSLTPPIKIELTTVSLVSATQANAVLTANGYVVAQVKAAVASKGAGRLEQLLVEEGDRVRRGQLLGRLEDRDVVAALAQAQANLAVARADSFDAQQSLARQRTLFASGLTSRAELDGAEARYSRVIAMIAASKAAVTAAEVSLENTRIRAPFNGTVLTKNADVGEVVAPFGAATNTRGAIVTMADMSSLQVEADVSESNITRVSIGQPCEITLDAYPERRYAGYVHKIVPTADRAKATVLTKVAFTGIDERVLPEMSAKVNFLTREGAAAAGEPPRLVVASSAVIARGGGWVAFRIRDEIVEEVRVNVGPTTGDQTQILEGLAAGDQVVLKASPSLATGMRITPK